MFLRDKKTKKIINHQKLATIQTHYTYVRRIINQILVPNKSLLNYITNFIGFIASDIGMIMVENSRLKIRVNDGAILIGGIKDEHENLLSL